MGVKLKSLSGEDVVAIFERFGFLAIAQTGSHVKLRRMNSQIVETLIIPSHSTISKGTLKAIFNQSTRYIPSQELRDYFFSAER